MKRLKKLVGISLQEIAPDPVMISRLLKAAERNLSDAGVVKISLESRFDIAYKSILQSANAALRASGYRTLTSKPGHHQTILQLLIKTAGVDRETLIVLDALRRQRNIVDYSGDLIPQSAVSECVAQAEYLVEQVRNWISTHHPGLIPD
jgi:uncharacterized protein (UPF0332 family)